MEVITKCEAEGCEQLVEGRCTSNFRTTYWSLIGKTCVHFIKKETTKMNIQEKDCRRCEKYDGEGYCNRDPRNRFKPDDIECGCRGSFTPVPGRDCRNCEHFRGHHKSCANGAGSVADTLPAACNDFTPLSASKSSPTVLVYTDEDEEKIRVTKGDKILSLERIWIDRPCGDEYREMSIIFTQANFNPDTDIPFTQENLDRLSNIAFAWLLNEDFFIKAEEEKVEETFKIGDWFLDKYGELFLLSKTGGYDCIGMIGITDSHLGKMWDVRPPIKVDNMDKITWKDINKLTGMPNWFTPTTQPTITKT